ncbi:MAG: sensor histidine kinase [Chloroflexota bacterium]
MNWLNRLFQALRNPVNLRWRLALAYTVVTGVIVLFVFFVILLIDSGGLENFGETSFIFVVMSLVITLIISFFGIVFGSVASRALVERVKLLDDAATAWAQGEFAVQVADEAQDEIGRLGRKLNGMAQQLDELVSERVDLAAVEERTRIARDLHDAVKQLLFASTLQLSSARSVVFTDADQTDQLLANLEQLLEQTQSELMTLIHMLRPALLGEQGLAQAIADYASTWSQQLGVVADSSLSYENRLPIELEQVLYRVMQEALANVARHANASTVRLKLEQPQKQTILQIVDDGQGFDAKQQFRGYGLQSMQERLTQIGGRCTIESQPKNGTTITAIVPTDLTKDEMK